jgi:hypothetical protein
MAYERYPRGGDSAGDYGQDYGSGRDYTYSSARDYAAAGQDGNRGRGRGGYGRDENRSSGDRDYGRGGDYGSRDYGARRVGQGSGGYGDARGSGQPYRGSYASDGHRFTDVEQDDRSGWDRDDRTSRDRNSGERYFGDRDHPSNHHHRDWGSRADFGSRNQGGGYGNYAERGFQDRSHGSGSPYGERSYGNRDHDRDRDRQGYGAQNRFRDDRDDHRSGGRPRGYDHDDRGFLERAGDEVRSWFGDEEAERRREMDQRYDEQRERHEDRHGSDPHYNNWRNAQIAEIDRDYAEYRQEHASKFSNEFSSWRTERQGQRSSLNRVQEHMEVVGSDGQHVGTVDKVRGDRILLTKNDVDAHGRHHSIPSRWIETVDDKVKIRKTADEAKSHWRDEERNESMLGDDAQRSSSTDRTSATTGGLGTPGTTGTLPTIGSTANTGGTSQTGTAAGSTSGGTSTGGTTPQGGSTFR